MGGQPFDAVASPEILDEYEETPGQFVREHLKKI
jgi:hypothetical protein